MKPFRQLLRHDPPHSWGDCYRTAIGCLLDMSPRQVPHFWDQGRALDEGRRMIGEFLREHDLTIVSIPYPCSVADVLMTMKNTNPHVFYMMCGQSGRNPCNHVVICLGDQVVWDPSTENSGVVGPGDDGFVWVEFLVPYSQTGEQYRAARRSARP